MYGFGLGISLLKSSHTGAGSLNGGCGLTVVLGVGGIIGPVFVFQSTLIAVQILRRQVVLTSK